MGAKRITPEEIKEFSIGFMKNMEFLLKWLAAVKPSFLLWYKVLLPLAPLLAFLWIMVACNCGLRRN